MSKVKYIPEGMHTVTPALNVKGCLEAIEFCKKAFGATVKEISMDPTGTKVWHSNLKIGDSIIMMYDEAPEMGELAHPSELMLYVENPDVLFKQAVDAGAKALMQPADMFWGDRMCKILDKWGNRWMIAKHIKDLTPEELKKAQDEFVANMKK